MALGKRRRFDLSPPIFPQLASALQASTEAVLTLNRREEKDDEWKKGERKVGGNEEGERREVRTNRKEKRKYEK